MSKLAPPPLLLIHFDGRLPAPRAHAQNRPLRDYLRYYLLLAMVVAVPALSPAPAQAQTLPALPSGLPPLDGTGSLMGTVLDSLDARPVPYATVLLLPAAAGADKAITGVAADDQGQFIITKVVPGPYRLRVSYVGYGTRTHAVTATTGATAVGSFRLPAAPTSLGEAVVVGQKPIVEVRPDRLVYQAEQDVSNAGGTAADVLRKAPLLAVDGDDQVTLRGSSNFRVLINNKPSPTLANNLADALKAIPADQIQRVEVITTPPAKYDGEGTAGLINIVLKKGVDRGVNGRVEVSSGNRNTNSNASLTCKKGKINISSAGGAGRWYGPSAFRRERTDFFVPRPDGTPAQLTQRGEGRYGGGWVYGSVGLDYDPAEHHAFSLAGSLIGYGGYNQQDLLNRYEAGDSVLNQLFVRDTKTVFSSFTEELTGTYTRTFAQARREWSVLGQAARTNGTFGYDFSQFNGLSAELPSAQADLRERSRGRTPGSEITLQTDFTQPFGDQQTLEAGLKSIWRQTGSIADVAGTSTPAGELVALPSRATNFDYHQIVQAAHATYSFSPLKNKKLNLSLGARGEHTSLRAHGQPAGTAFRQDYANLLPNGNAQYAFNEAASLRLSYTRRITRPFIDYLNPFVDRSDPRNLSVGNPALSPELTDAYELSYNTLIKTTSLSLTSSVRRTGNAIGRVLLPAGQVRLPDNVLTTDAAVTVGTYRNVAANTIAQLTFYGSSKPVTNWDLSGGPTVEYVVRHSPALGLTRRGFSANLNLNTSYKLPKDFTAQAFVQGSLRTLALQGKGPANLHYNLGLKKSFRDKKADVVVNIISPFNNTWTNRNNLATNAFRENQQTINFPRAYRVSLSYRFGQAQQGRQRKSIRNDDMKSGVSNRPSGQ